VATPYRAFDGPRVISEVRKSYATNNLIDFRPKLAGDLLVRTSNEKKWWPRRAVVRNGQLQLSGGHGDGAPTALRLPLRHLSLKAGALPNSLSLCKGQTVVLTLQVRRAIFFPFPFSTLLCKPCHPTAFLAFWSVTRPLDYLHNAYLPHYWAEIARIITKRTKSGKYCNSASKLSRWSGKLRRWKVFSVV
jgi:hypothetical protein